MKRTYTVNLNNAVYQIDFDAYDVLHKYLSEVENRLSHEERKEVMADIEARISELFTEKLQKDKNVINIEDVEEVIAILGKPNQINDDEEDAGSESSHTQTKRIKKRFYRDIDNALLGGVASGLAALLGWDILLVRIILIFLLIIGYGTVIPIYLIIWLITPAARTIAQKLEMQGEEATAERIKQEFNNIKNYVESEKFKDNATQAGSKLGEVIRVIFKVLFGVFGAIVGLIGFLLLGALFLTISVLLFEPASISGFLPDITSFSSGWGIAMIISIIFVAGIPIFGMLYFAARIISGRSHRKGHKLGWALGIVWLVSILVFTALSFSTISRISRGYFDGINLEWSFENDQKFTTLRNPGSFSKIEASGNIEVEIIQDTVESVLVISHPNIAQHVITNVVDSVLHISTEKTFVNREIKVIVRANQFSNIHADGMVQISSEGRIRSDNLEIKLSGFTKADLDVHVSQDLIANLSGSTELELEGLAYSFNAESSDISNIEAYGLLVRNANIKATGTSQVEVNAADSLWVVLTGTSTLTYMGNPAHVKESLSGLARIKRM